MFLFTFPPFFSRVEATDVAEERAYNAKEQYDVLATCLSFYFSFYWEGLHFVKGDKVKHEKKHAAVLISGCIYFDVRGSLNGVKFIVEGHS